MCHADWEDTIRIETAAVSNPIRSESPGIQSNPRYPDCGGYKNVHAQCTALCVFCECGVPVANSCGAARKRGFKPSPRQRPGAAFMPKSVGVRLVTRQGDSDRKSYGALFADSRVCGNRSLCDALSRALSAPTPRPGIIMRCLCLQLTPPVLILCLGVSMARRRRCLSEQQTAFSRSDSSRQVHLRKRGECIHRCRAPFAQ